MSLARLDCIFARNLLNSTFLIGDERWDSQHSHDAKIVRKDWNDGILRAIWMDICCFQIIIIVCFCGSLLLSQHVTKGQLTKTIKRKTRKKGTFVFDMFGSVCFCLMYVFFVDVLLYKYYCIHFLLQCCMSV